MKLYRIQDKDGRGPFKPGFSHIWIRFRKDSENLKPLIAPEIARIDGEHHAIGCKSIEMLRRWFTKKEYRTLRRHGYQAVIIRDAKVLKEDETQSLFARTTPLNLNVVHFKLY